MNKDKLVNLGVTSLEKVVTHLETDDGKRTVEAVNVTLVSLATTFAAARGLRKIARRFGVELTRKEAYGLVVAAASIVAALDPNKGERIKRALSKKEPAPAPKVTLRKSFS